MSNVNVITAQEILAAINATQQNFHTQVKTSITLSTLQESMCGMSQIHVDNTLELKGLFSITLSSIVNLTEVSGSLVCLDIDQNTENTYVILNGDSDDTQFIFENEVYDSIELSNSHDFHSTILSTVLSHITTTTVNKILDQIIVGNNAKAKQLA